MSPKRYTQHLKVKIGSIWYQIVCKWYTYSTLLIDINIHATLSIPKNILELSMLDKINYATFVILKNIY